MNYDYLIVGAGLAGSTLAYILDKAGFKVKVIDKRNHIAGNCYTEVKDGINIHKYGAHIFHTSDKAVWRFITQFGDFNNFINSPIAVTENNEVYNMPFNMNTFSKMFNTRWPHEVSDILQAEVNEYKEEHPTVENLEDQAISLVGITIFNKLIKGYTEKQWNADCKDLDASIIKRLPLRMTYNNNYFNDKYQGIPVNGYTSIIENMLDGIEVELNSDYFDRKEYYNNSCKHIIYTGRIDEFYNFEFGELDYRSLKFVETKLNTSNYQGNAVVNFTGRTPKHTRVIEHKHFNNDESDVSWITTEYPSNEGDPYYPINNKRNNDLYNKYKELSEKDTKVIFAGRLGKYKYFDMDDVILDCFDIIKSIIDA